MVNCRPSQSGSIHLIFRNPPLFKSGRQRASLTGVGSGEHGSMTATPRAHRILEPPFRVAPPGPGGGRQWAANTARMNNGRLARRGDGEKDPSCRPRQKKSGPLTRAKHAMQGRGWAHVGTTKIIGGDLRPAEERDWHHHARKKCRGATCPWHHGRLPVFGTNKSVKGAKGTSETIEICKPACVSSARIARIIVG